MSDDWTVSDGRVLVNSGRRLIDNESVKVWEFDLRTKYAEVVTYASTSEGIHVLLGASERTLYLGDEGSGMTAISFPYPGWSALAEIGRYTLHVAAFDPYANPSRESSEKDA